MAGERFSGSYLAEDVCFLLQRVQQKVISVEEKEVLIQSGARHYSELIGPEPDPSPAYLAEFEAALTRNGDRLARDILRLAAHIAHTHPAGAICLVSLARAGTPIGVLLRRTLSCVFGRTADHVSVSILAGRGIDCAALDTLRAQRAGTDRDVVFVDGWTGKGVIAQELRRSVTAYNARTGAALDPSLHVIADLCGQTEAAATATDYLIPSCLLGATVSGLISRTILNEHTARTGGLHGCVYYEALLPVDRSRAFVDAITAHVLRLAPTFAAAPLPVRDRAQEAARATDAVERWRTTAGLSAARHVKPGIGEATRVLLRRVAERLVVRDAYDPEVRATLLLAEEKRVRVQTDPSLPWAALACIRETSS